MRKTVTARRYELKLSTAQMLSILEYDEGDHDGLGCQLEQLHGVTDVNYHDNFGTYVWLTLGVNHDHPSRWKQIDILIAKASKQQP